LLTTLFIAFFSIARVRRVEQNFTTANEETMRVYNNKGKIRNAKASFMPCTTMQGQILFSFIYSMTRAADITLVSIVGPKPKNFK
jgi:hypothetical protein